VENMVSGITAKLSNASFVERAPAEVVAKEREKLQAFAETLVKLKRNYDALET